jgi:hypothetical protein
MDNMDEDETMEEGKMKEKDMKEGKMKEKDMKEGYDMDEAKHMNKKEMDEMEMDEMDMYEADEMDEAKKEMDEMDLDELLRELESMDEDDMMEGDSMDEGKAAYEYEKGKKAGEKKAMNEEEGMLNDPKGPTAHGNVAEEEEVEASEEEIDIENMDESDLKKFIESVISDMVEAGELEAGDSMEGEEDDDEDEMATDDKMMAEVKKMKKEVEEGLLDFLKKKKATAPTKPSGPKLLGVDFDGNYIYDDVNEIKKELKEAYNAISTIKTELQEVNLFNAKLLYTNKIFKAKNLTESQKVKVLAAFDKAASVKEAKLVFETLSEGMKETKKTVNESLLRGSASKAAGVVAKKPILEVNDQFARWQTLAGIKK